MDNWKPRKPPAINASVLPDGRWLLYNSVTREAIPLSPAAGILWELCDGQSQLPQIVAELAALYPDVPADTLDQQARDALTALVQQGLLDV